MCFFKKSLKSLNGEELSDLINSLGKKNRIFHCEAQFQFELAWKLQEHYDCEVKLEDVTAVIKDVRTAKKQKIYTDIVLEKDGYKIALELKYKTDTIDNDNIAVLYKDGAADIGRYDFLWDVNRIELLKDPTKKIPIECHIYKENLGKDVSEEYFDVKKHVDKGFAVLLTNEKKYWKECYCTKKKATIDEEFKIGENSPYSHKGKLFNKKMNWRLDTTKLYPYNYPKTARDPISRARPIELLEPYEYEWQKYCSLSAANKDGEFKYLIIAVD